MQRATSVEYSKEGSTAHKLSLRLFSGRCASTCCMPILACGTRVSPAKAAGDAVELNVLTPATCHSRSILKIVRALACMHQYVALGHHPPFSHRVQEPLSVTAPELRA
jgi:hypothetical protein